MISSTALSGKNAIGIDTFQKIKEIGYLGNPASFTGTYIHYLAHEALYYNHLQEVFQDNGEVYDEIVVFDREHYTGGWAASISDTIDIPTEFSSLAYNKMEVELLRGCPDADMNYSDAGCDDYDRIARMYLCDLDGTILKHSHRFSVVVENEAEFLPFFFSSHFFSSLSGE